MKQKNIEYFESGLLSKTQLDISLKGLNQKFPNGIPVCGADALRFSLLQLDFKEENVNFGVHNVIANKNFCNKIHQSVNFFISNIDNRFEKIDISSVLLYFYAIFKLNISKFKLFFI
jgi:valyl-tRNA synthetase